LQASGPRQTAAGADQAHSARAGRQRGRNARRRAL